MGTEDLYMKLPVWALVIYLMFRDLILPLVKRILPLKAKQDEQAFFLRREADKRLADLEERKTKAQEDVASTLVLLSERMNMLEREYKTHDDRQSAITAQISNTLSAMQGGMSVLLDRSTRAQRKQPKEPKDAEL